MSRHGSTSGSGRQRQSDPPATTPTSTGPTSVWVGTHPFADHAHNAPPPPPPPPLGSEEGYAPPQPEVVLRRTTTSRSSSSSSSAAAQASHPEEASGPYVVVSVRNSASDSHSEPPNSARSVSSSSQGNDPYSPRSSGGVRSAFSSSSSSSPFSATRYDCANGQKSRRVVSTSSVSDSSGPFSPVSPTSPAPVFFNSDITNVQSNFNNNNYNNPYPQNAAVLNGTTIMDGSNSNSSLQGLALAGSHGAGGGLVGTSTSNASYLIGGGNNFQGPTVAGNTAGAPGGGGAAMMMMGSTSALYNGLGFVPAMASSMAMLPQQQQQQAAGYATVVDPPGPGGLTSPTSSYLLQRQLDPNVLAASLNETLTLVTGRPPVQHVQPVQHQPPLPPHQFPPQTLLPPLSISQAQSIQSDVVRSPSFTQQHHQQQPFNLLPQPQLQPLQQPPIQTVVNVSQSQSVPAYVSPQSPGLSPNQVLLQQQQQLQQRKQQYDDDDDEGGERWRATPYLGQSFEMLSAAVEAARSQALTSPTSLRSPTTSSSSPRSFSPTDSNSFVPQYQYGGGGVVTPTPAGLPPTFTGIPPASSASSPPPLNNYAPSSSASSPPPLNNYAPSSSVSSPPPLNNYAPSSSASSPPPLNNYAPSLMMTAPASSAGSYYYYGGQAVSVVDVPGQQRRGVVGGGGGGSLCHSSSLDDQATSGVGSSIPSSPTDSSPTSPNSDLHLLADEGQGFLVEPCYTRPRDRAACLRCGQKVYAMEKVGPVKDVLFHKGCFTCGVCSSTLTLHNFCHNDADMNDLNVYCGSHKPTPKANPLDSNAVGIQRALSVPRRDRVNDQIRGGPEAGRNTHIDSRSVSIRTAMHVPAPDLQASIKTKKGAWFREQRKPEGMPPRDVVRHDGKEQGYQGSRSLYIN